MVVLLFCVRAKIVRTFLKRSEKSIKKRLPFRTERASLFSRQKNYELFAAVVDAAVKQQIEHQYVAAITASAASAVSSAGVVASAAAAEQQ